jgi:hypothetical protein
MRFVRRPIFATLVIAVGLSLTACVASKDPVGPISEPPPEDPGDFTAGQAYSGGTVVHLFFG